MTEYPPELNQTEEATPEEEAPVPTDEALLLGEIPDLLRVATSSRRSAPPPTA